MKMKIILLILGIIAILFILSQLYFMSSQRNIEQYSFEVLEAYDEIEIRQYEASLVTSVQLSSNDYKKSSSKGFSILAGYIFGGNDKNEKIAMTSPVAMTLKDSTTMMFLVPKKYSKENLPTPNDASIEFKKMPAKKVATFFAGIFLNSILASFGVGKFSFEYFFGTKNIIVVESLSVMATGDVMAIFSFLSFPPKI